MESSADRYLHKKFKKQLSIEPKYNVEVKNEVFPASVASSSSSIPPRSQRKNGTQEHINPMATEDQQQQQQQSSTTLSTISKDNKECVPNSSSVLSTNNYIDLMNSARSRLANVPSSISTATTTTATSNVVNVKLENETKDWRANSSAEPTITTNCISQCITTSAIASPQNFVQYNSFDTANSNAAVAINLQIGSSGVDKSSIFDNNVYSTAETNTPTVLEENAKNQNADASQTSDKKTEGKYVCAYCNLACSKPSVLQKHIRAHTNERPYPCVSCGFSFKTRSNLYKHCRSRTHANRVMGNKMQEATGGEFIEAEKVDYMDQNSPENLLDEAKIDATFADVRKSVVVVVENEPPEVMRNKPYKPRFHTVAKTFYENVPKENIADNVVVAMENRRNLDVAQSKHANPDLLSHHINELINKNNSIVNSTEPYLQKRRVVDNGILENNNECINRYSDNVFAPQTSSSPVETKSVDEPLNLTKNRKRCVSEADHSTNRKSLIKELLLKSLNADSNLQCPYCKMLFQSVPELELHKMRNCKGHVKSGARYSRSSSVNVASILTQNKNAFDNIPQFHNATFPLKSPGPFLGKTRLIEADKYSERSKSFSFDDLPGTTSVSSPVSPYGPTELLNKPMRNFPISPLTLRPDKGVPKKSPVKLFGGEVKITQTSGETRSFKIENKDVDQFTDEGFVEYGTKVSENRVIKSSLQSGGTVLQSKPTKPEKSPDVIRVYESSSIYSPNIDIMLSAASSTDDKNKFNFRPEIIHNQLEQHVARRYAETDVNSPSATRENAGKSNLYKYTNIMDFSQKAVKLLAPNLKQPNLSIPGIPAPIRHYSKEQQQHQQEVIVKNCRQTPESMNFMSKQQLKIVEPNLAPAASNMYNPMNLFVDGKVVRYVPGMPGPIATESPPDPSYHTGIISVGRPLSLQPPPPTATKLCLKINVDQHHGVDSITPTDSFKIELKHKPNELIVPKPMDTKSPSTDSSSTLKLPEQKSPNFLSVPSTTSSSSSSSPSSSSSTEIRKFVRPTSLALKPSMAAVKQHHGLTPTMFNQALISPDTPRIAKKYNQHYINGNYFSCLGLKSSTKPVYCTLNKTQPFYVTHFKKLSMYSEWRQQDNKPDKMYASNYDSRQRQSKYSVAGKTSADLIAHSSYKFVSIESSSGKEDDKSRTNSVLGGYESNEDYTYIRGRGRGRYVCDQCGIRCKKPSMLKKHIRTHSDDRPYTCQQCNFSFKTKGNLTKHMKSKTHEKKYAATSCSSSQPSGTPSSGSASDSDDSDMDSYSDESTRLQEHEAAHCLLRLSQKSSQNICTSSPNDPYTSAVNLSYHQTNESSNHSITNEEHLDDTKPILSRGSKQFEPNRRDSSNTSRTSSETSETPDNNIKVIQFLGKSSSVRPLTYPYQQIEIRVKSTPALVEDMKSNDSSTFEQTTDNKLFQNHRSKVIQRNNIYPNFPISTPAVVASVDSKVNNDVKKRKLSTGSDGMLQFYVSKVHKSETSEAMDLSMPSSQDHIAVNLVENGYMNEEALKLHNQKDGNYFDSHMMKKKAVIDCSNFVGGYEDIRPPKDGLRIAFNVINHENSNQSMESMDSNSLPDNLPNSSGYCEPGDGMKPFDYDHDNSAMQTLAEIATKQVKLEKNTLAKSVASEYLKLATKSVYNDGNGSESVKTYVSTSKDGTGELCVKPEENKNCSICSKSFSKPSQLRLHMNVHYLERPFRCDSCSVSFRTKGHLQKHERSASHNNKLSSSPALSSSEPRPFKCSDCNIAFRIHGHLAKHLRSKMHIMKLECLAKIPFGLYAELERANSLLTEINTADGDQCLESLRTLARKLFINDGSKLNQLESIETVDVDS